MVVDLAAILLAAADIVAEDAELDDSLVDGFRVAIDQRLGEGLDPLDVVPVVGRRRVVEIRADTGANCLEHRWTVSPMEK